MREPKIYRILAKPAPNDLFDPVLEKRLIDKAYELGFEAYLSHGSNCENPFNPDDWQRSSAWFEGRAAAENYSN